MGNKSLIEWTDATWNFLLGCSKVSSGCAHCYAVGEVWRMAHNPAIAETYAGLVERHGNGRLDWTGGVRVVHERLLKPVVQQQPRRYFVNSLSDVFHVDVSEADLDLMVAVMAVRPEHVFQILTKRPERQRAYFAGLERHGLARVYDRAWANPLFGNAKGLPWHAAYRRRQRDGRLPTAWPLPNVWVGTSVEDQRAAEERIHHLVNTPAAVRFLSCEPLLGPLELSDYLTPKPEVRSFDLFGATPERAREIREAYRRVGPKLIHWVIVGGESGHEARPMHPAWARGIRDQCLSVGVAFLFKQWGNWAPPSQINPEYQDGALLDSSRSRMLDPETEVVNFGKKLAGRVLDGGTWDDFPAAAAVPA